MRILQTAFAIVFFFLEILSFYAVLIYFVCLIAIQVLKCLMCEMLSVLFVLGLI